MAGPSWLTSAFAAVMILTACYSASRLVVSRLREPAIEADADGLHAVMGTAMAGMLVPQLALLPRTAWIVVFGTGTAWFGARALRSRNQSRFSWQCRYPVPHLIECIAMLYMLLAVHGAQQGAGMAMPGMGASPLSSSGGFPALAVLLALFMLGYTMWTTDQLASLARARTTTPRQAGTPQHQALVTVPSGSRAASMITAADTPDTGAMPQQAAASQTLLASELAALGKIAMGITMGYMLILML